ncbi:MAG: DUF438 domain-containing protein [Nitrososphaeria archaeon]
MSYENVERKEVLKRLIRRLHEGEKIERIKGEFRKLLNETSPDEVAQVEEELVKEGVPLDIIRELCNVHLELFRESLEKGEAKAQVGHPVHILMEEHRMLLKYVEELEKISNEIEKTANLEPADERAPRLSEIMKNFKESGSHYQREENVLFLYLEEHGITQPPAVMWKEHDKIREIEKKLFKSIDTRESLAFKDFAEQLKEGAVTLTEMLSSHFYKENNILFPTALKVIGEEEWKDIRRQFDELGYCQFTPKSATVPFGEAEELLPKPEASGLISFETGTMSKEELESLLNTLPIDVTFVDKDDTVRYYSQTRGRIFTRTKALIGRKVQQCHPQKSVHIVNRILEDFRKGIRDKAEFWINFQGRFIHIRYFPVRNRRGDYIGCIEVTQDITDIKKLEGERRLLDWS